MSKILQFLKEVKAEFHQITWPQKDTLIQLTFVVISISVIISLILGAFDYLFTNSFALIGNLNKPNLPRIDQTAPSEPQNQIQIDISPAATSSTPIPTK